MNTYTTKQIGAAVLTVAIYTFIFHSLWPALLLAGAVGWHEYCHLVAARQMGLPTKGFFLLPFIGGVALVAGRYRSYAQQAYVVLAGPVGGGIGALATGSMYLVLRYLFHIDLPWMAAATYWMCALNLFNLAPFSFMDGGQLLGTITYSIHRTLGVWCLVVSTAVAVIALMYWAPIIGLLIAVLGTMSVYKELKNWNAWRQDISWQQDPSWIYPPKKLNKQQMITTICCWVGASAVLGGAMYLLKVVAPLQATFGYLFHQ